jgi:signal transduction histidine kinase
MGVELTAHGKTGSWKEKMLPKVVSPHSDTQRIHSRRETWMRWLKVWHAVFYLSLVMAISLTVISGTMHYSIPLVLGLSLFLGLWYGLIMVWLVYKYQGKRQATLSFIFIVVALVVWFPLSRANWAYYLVASSFYGIMWGTLPFRLAAAGNIALTGLIIWSQALNVGKPVTLSVELFLGAGMTIVWSTLLALWIRSVIRESAERKHLIEQLEETQRGLADAERQAGILEERQRMAQEIHDTLAQSFTSIVMQLEAADLALPEEQSELRTRLLQARETARLGLAEARRLVQALRPEPLEGASLPEAMKRVADRWRQETGAGITITVTGNPCFLHPQVEVSLLRMLQEGLANVYKHARAHQVTITLSYMEDQVALDIHDDGVGFDPQLLDIPPDQSRGGFGLQTMRERASQIGGQMIVESYPGQGTTLAFQIPVEASG